MTIGYNHDVATRSTWRYLRVLLHWRASIWQYVAAEVVVWTALYYVVFALYYGVMDTEARYYCRLFAGHIRERIEWISITFLLGFFVAQVMSRWERVSENIGFIESVCHALCYAVRADGESAVEARLARRNIVRWLCLAQVLVLRDISIRVRRRFPTLESLHEAGYMERAEMDWMSGGAETSYNRYWMPFHWIQVAIKRMCCAGLILCDPPGALLAELSHFRHQLHKLCSFDWMPIPLAYTQVVFIAVRIYFLFCLLARQPFAYSLNDERPLTAVDYYLPFMTLVQLVIYIGWAKVAESHLNPLGDDEDDFELNYLIDLNLRVGMMLVDECYEQAPSHLVEDRMGAGDRPLYSHDAQHDRQNPHVGSAVLEAETHGLMSDTAPMKMVERGSTWLRSALRGLLTRRTRTTDTPIARVEHYRRGLRPILSMPRSLSDRQQSLLSGGITEGGGVKSPTGSTWIG